MKKPGQLVLTLNGSSPKIGVIIFFDPRSEFGYYKILWNDGFFCWSSKEFINQSCKVIK